MSLVFVVTSVQSPHILSRNRRKASPSLPRVRSLLGEGAAQRGCQRFGMGILGFGFSAELRGARLAVGRKSPTTEEIGCTWVDRYMSPLISRHGHRALYQAEAPRCSAFLHEHQDKAAQLQLLEFLECLAGSERRVTLNPSPSCAHSLHRNQGGMLAVLGM